MNEPVNDYNLDKTPDAMKVRQLFHGEKLMLVLVSLSLCLFAVGCGNGGTGAVGTAKDCGDAGQAAGTLTDLFKYYVGALGNLIQLDLVEDITPMVNKVQYRFVALSNGDAGFGESGNRKGELIGLPRFSGIFFFPETSGRRDQQADGGCGE